MSDPMDDLDEYLDNANENGVHSAIFKGIKTRDNDDQGRNWVICEFQIADVDDPFDQETYSAFFQNFNHVTLEDFNGVLTAQEKSKVRSAKKRLLEFLLSLGFSETEAKSIRKDPKESEYVNDMDLAEYRITITVSSARDGRKEYKNITLVQRVVEDDGSHGMLPF